MKKFFFVLVLLFPMLMQAQGLLDRGYIAPDPHHANRYLKGEDVHEGKATILQYYKKEKVCKAVVMLDSLKSNGRHDRYNDTLYIFHLPDSLSSEGRIFCFSFYYSLSSDKRKAPKNERDHKFTEFVWVNDEVWNRCFKRD